MTKEEILKQEGYREYDAMDEYAKQVAVDFAKWVMETCCQDLGDISDERWSYNPKDSDEYEEKTSDELYTEFLKQYNQ